MQIRKSKVQLITERLIWRGALVVEVFGLTVICSLSSCQYLPNQDVPPQVLTLNAPTSERATAGPLPESTSDVSLTPPEATDPPTPSITPSPSIEEVTPDPSAGFNGILSVRFSGTYTPREDQPVLRCVSLTGDCLTSITLIGGSPVAVYAYLTVWPEGDKFACIDLPTFGDPTEWGFCGRMVAVRIGDVEYGDLSPDTLPGSEPVGP